MARIACPTTRIFTVDVDTISAAVYQTGEDYICALLQGIWQRRCEGTPGTNSINIPYALWPFRRMVPRLKSNRYISGRCHSSMVRTVNPRYRDHFNFVYDASSFRTGSSAGDIASTTVHHPTFASNVSSWGVSMGKNLPSDNFNRATVMHLPSYP